jgi:hypothetical protein
MAGNEKHAGATGAHGDCWKRRIAVLIAYLTTDEVNEDLATRMTHDCGVGLVVLSPKDPSPDSQFDAVIYDLDYVPPSLRDELLAKLMCGPSSFPVAVHSYNLTDDQIKSLLQTGVSVYRRLEPALFLNLVVAWRLRQLASAQNQERERRNGQQQMESAADHRLDVSVERKR